MGLMKSTAQAVASVSNSAGGTTTSSTFDTNYGVSGVALVTNGATGPTVACDVVVEVSADGGSSWDEWSRQTAALGNNVVTTIVIGLGLGGSGADFGKYRIKFTGNTAQAVSVAYDGQSTTAL